MVAGGAEVVIPVVAVAIRQAEIRVAVAAEFSIFSAQSLWAVAETIRIAVVIQEAIILMAAADDAVAGLVAVQATAAKNTSSAIDICMISLA